MYNGGLFVSIENNLYTNEIIKYYVLNMKQYNVDTLLLDRIKNVYVITIGA